MDASDAQLLHDYAKDRSDAAFAALIERYLGLVYSSCWRQLRDRHLAEDATQAVFVLVSRKAAAGTLRAQTLASWLLSAARYTCANLRRSEMRRRRHETAVAMEPQPQAVDGEMLAMLDDALAKLRERDRQAVALRYLQGRPLREVGQVLGVSEEAARKRVDRCVEKLRKYFARRGVATESGAMIGSILATHSGANLMTDAARTQLIGGILHACHDAAAGAAPAVLSLANGTNAMMRVTKAKAAAGFVLMVAGVTAGSWSAVRVLDGTVQTTTARPAADSAAPSTRPVPLAITPTTAPDADLSTPFAMLESLSRALKNGDAAAAYACLNVDPHRTPTAMDCLFAENLAHSRWMRTARAAFPRGVPALYQIVPADQVIDVLVALGRAGTTTPTIDGNSATVTLSVPDAAQAAFPPYARVFVRAWSGQVIRFSNVAGQWKLDDVPMRAVDTNTGKAFDTATEIAGMMAYADALDRITAKVRDRRITTAAQAQGAYDYECDRIKRLYPGLSLNVSVVPVQTSEPKP